MHLGYQAGRDQSATRKRLRCARIAIRNRQCLRYVSGTGSGVNIASLPMTRYMISHCHSRQNLDNSRQSRHYVLFRGTENAPGVLG